MSVLTVIGVLAASASQGFLVAEKYAAAMNELAETDGLIVDLRRNAGGDPSSVVLLVCYFVDQRTRLNDIRDRETGNTIRNWTQDRLEGKRQRGKKPVLILAGPDTMSAGEDFAYTMQALKRATVAGERTWGGAGFSGAPRLPSQDTGESQGLSGQAARPAFAQRLAFWAGIDTIDGLLGSGT